MLTLPPKFKQALGNGTRTSLYPLVRIYKGVQIDDPLDSATEVINLSIKETNIGGEAYNPLLLNSPSISSKADIINNKYTISSVSLSISNAPYNGKIFSDDIPSLLNAVVQVYYAANGLDTLEDCLLVYTGTIRRYSQSAETLSLTLEDLTEQKLKTQIPSTLIEDEDNFTEDSIGKPYPMVYGYVDKSPLVLNKYDSLIIDKPNKEIFGTWGSVSDINYQNDAIKDTELYETWLQRYAYLSVYKDGYMPIMQQFPLNFGTRLHNTNEGEVYNFQNNTVNNSAKINLNPSTFIYEQYTTQEGEDAGDSEDYEVGVGNIGIPTRIYRPVEKISFYAKNHPSESFREAEFPDDEADDYKYHFQPRSSNKFYGFSNTAFNEGVSVNFENETIEDDAYNTFTNDFSHATDAYDDAISNDELTWWEPTELNYINVTEDGTWDSKDANFPLENQDFNPYWIQNASNTSGIHIHSINRHTSEGGCFARLQLNQDVPDFPAVTKIFYKIDYFAPTHFTTGEEAEPSAFWHERQLLVRNRNDNESFEDLVTTQNDWHEYYDNIGGTWTTACEFPNHEHPRETDSANHRYTNERLGGMEFDNIILGFNSTKTTDSINWGLPAIKGQDYQASSCLANLKQFYTIQDIIIPEYVKETFYASIVGRIKTDEIIISKPHNILNDILKEELSYGKDVILPDETIPDDWINSFSMNEQEEAKSVIENLFKSSIYIPSFDSAGNFKFIDLKQNIEDYNEFEAIDNQDILKYSFALTKLEDIKNQVNVKYKKDYGSGNFSEATTYGIEDNNGNFVETLDELIEQLNIDDMVYDIAYYGMTDADAKLEVETEYIRDKDTARKLQRRLLMWYANQHLTMKLDLPASYIHLEAGDYIRFDELIGGKLAFGFDYTQEFVKNGQLIYPVFFVTKVAKSLSKVSLELVQVHRGDFGMNDTNLNNYEIPNPYDNNIYQDTEEEEEEYFAFNWYLDNNNLETGVISAVTDTNLETGIEYEVLLTGSSATFTYNDLTIEEGVHQEIDATNLVNASIVETGSEYGDNVQITPKMFFDDESFQTDEEVVFLEFELTIKSDTYDYSQKRHFMQSMYSFEFELGDVNQDGVINVQDIFAAIGLLLSGNHNDLADMNQDGGINVLDIVILIGLILG